MTTLYDLSQILKHLPGKHSQASHASKKGGMPDRFAKEFGMDPGTYEEVARSLERKQSRRNPLLRGIRTVSGGRMKLMMNGSSWCRIY